MGKQDMSELLGERDGDIREEGMSPSAPSALHEGGGNRARHATGGRSRSVVQATPVLDTGDGNIFGLIPNAAASGRRRDAAAWGRAMSRGRRRDIALSW